MTHAVPSPTPPPEPTSVASPEVEITREMVAELASSLNGRVGTTGDVIDLERRVRTTLQDMAPIHVTAFLPVLLERRLRRNASPAS